ncbi:hypothetical protein HZC07_00615 [Candidatus Micrarchaeota archaeon]|nr:hypothetical protein [Candidatus Micrarchaeota archaeon]
MGNIMISVDEEKEKEIRKYAHEICGGKKGSLSEFVWEAIEHYIFELKKEKNRHVAFDRMINRMKNAKKLNILNKEGMAYSSRDELYER